MMGAILWNMAVLLATGSTGFRFLFLLLSSILPLKGLSWRIPLPKRLKVFRTLYAVIDRQVILRYQVMQPIICGNKILMFGRQL
jgi:hypothetical protein